MSLSAVEPAKHTGYAAVPEIILHMIEGCLVYSQKLSLPCAGYWRWALVDSGIPGWLR